MTHHAFNYAVVGHPIAHSLSPQIHAAFAAQTGETDVRYGRLDIEPEDFARGCRNFFATGGLGLNVTSPHKGAALALCDHASDGARLAGAVNTLSLSGDGGLRGDNTDGAGLVRDLRRHLRITLRDARILIVGAGGAGRGVAGPLLDRQPRRLTIANRTRQTAIDAAHSLRPFGNVRGCGLPETGARSYDLIINATTASLHGAALPALPDDVAEDAVCYDMMYAPGGTAFTDWATRHGARSVHTGIGMLVEQAALSFRIWRGVRPDTGPVLAALMNELGLKF